MDSPESVREFAEYGNFKTPLGMTYLLYAAHICEVISPGDLVLDLGCGPGNLLLLVAQLNPHSKFIGMDLSEVMLAEAKVAAQNLGVKNIRFVKGDMTNLEKITSQSIDACCSTLAMHHLPSLFHLNSMFREIARVLKPQGGLFLTDYGRFKSEETMRFVAYKYQNRQSQLLTIDYFNSLKASFSFQEIKNCFESELISFGKLSVTPLLPIAISIKSLSRRPRGDIAYQEFLRSKVSELDIELQKDFNLLLKMFKWGNLGNQCYNFV